MWVWIDQCCTKDVGRLESHRKYEAPRVTTKIKAKLPDLEERKPNVAESRRQLITNLIVSEAAGLGVPANTSYRPFGHSR
jgi:hypothetical protein